MGTISSYRALISQLFLQLVKTAVNGESEVLNRLVLTCVDTFYDSGVAHEVLKVEFE